MLNLVELNNDGQKLTPYLPSPKEGEHTTSKYTIFHKSKDLNTVKTVKSTSNYIDDDQSSKAKKLMLNDPKDITFCDNMPL